MSASPIFIKGTCKDMCPTRERRLREKEGLLHQLEQPLGVQLKHPLHAHPHLTIKSFSRSAAGQQTPCHDDLRPPDILQKTVHHLLTNIVMREDMNWCTVYDFVFDRLRAVRQDLVIQGLSDVNSITILEAVVRFHTYAGYRLCTEPLSKFDSTINHRHVLECLKRLLVLYDEQEQMDKQDVRAEMEALYLLLGLGDSIMLNRALNLPVSLRQHPVIKTAFAISIAMWHGNFVRVCNLLPHLPPLLMCAAAQQFPGVRRQALAVMSTAYSSRNLTFPLHVLQQLLLYQTQSQAEEDCKKHGIIVKEGNIVFSKGTFTPTSVGSCLRMDCVDAALNSCKLPQLLLRENGLVTSGVTKSKPVSSEK